MTGILIEGVTGAGKTQTELLGSGPVFSEDETFGEVMAEMQEVGVSNNYLLRRLPTVLGLLEQDGAGVGFVLERFHLSYYALLPDWDLYAGFDERLARLNCLTVLLNMPEEDIAQRCIDREDRVGSTWSNDMIAHFGSRAGVVDAIVQSTRRRQEAAKKSRLSILQIDSGLKAWHFYAEEIVEAWSALI